MPKDNPVLRVLFHADKQNLHNEHHGRAQPNTNTYRSSPSTICVQLLATQDFGYKHGANNDFSFSSKTSVRNFRTTTCSSNGRDGTCLGQITLPASWWPPLVGNANTWKHDDDNSLGKSFKKATTKQPKVNVKVSYLVYETNEDSCEGSEGKLIYLISKLGEKILTFSNVLSFVICVF